MAEKTKEKESKKIEFKEEDFENVFTDIVQVNVKNETVALDLAIQNKDNKTAEISHRVYMTLPHFLRFSNVCYNIGEEIKKRLEEEDGSLK